MSRSVKDVFKRMCNDYGKRDNTNTKIKEEGGGVTCSISHRHGRGMNLQYKDGELKKIRNRYR